MTRNLKYPEPYSTEIKIDETVMVNTKAVKTRESLYRGAGRGRGKALHPMPVQLMQAAL